MGNESEARKRSGGKKEGEREGWEGEEGGGRRAR